MKSPLQIAIFLAILLATATVAAQVYKWVDKDGKVQYSDSPPPASAGKTEPKKMETAPATTAAPANAPGKSLQERAKDYDKRRSETAEKTKKDDEAQKNAEVDQENCRDARAALADLESGRPISRANANGERAFMTDEQRQTDIQKARAMIASACKG